MFQLASTTGAGLSVLHSFLSHLEPAYQSPQRGQEASGNNAAADVLEEQSGSKCNMPEPYDTAYREPQPSMATPSQASGVPWALEAGVDGEPVPLADLPGSLKLWGRGGTRRAVERPGPSSPAAPAHFQVDQTFEVRGVGSGAAFCQAQTDGASNRFSEGLSTRMCCETLECTILPTLILHTL